MSVVPTGRYRHYKGKDYQVLGVARHSETLEEVVVYRQEYGDRGLWVRPMAMFQETVNFAGRAVPRFQRLEAPSAGGHEVTANLLHDVPRSLPEERVQTLLETTEVRIERIVSHGHASPEDFWYDQPQAEWVTLLRGAARLRFEGKAPIEMRPGDSVHIPAHRRHRVDWTTPDEPTVWLAVHYGAGLQNDSA